MTLNMLILMDFLLDYFPPKAEVTGSNPVGCTIISMTYRNSLRPVCNKYGKQGVKSLPFAGSERVTFRPCFSQCDA
jgi:hypothetical protein